MADKFKVGDLIQHEQGGPVMRVVSVDNDDRRLIAQWNFGDQPHSASAPFDLVVMCAESSQQL